MSASSNNGSANGHDAGYSADAVRTHLRRILESPAFKGSKRSQAFLEYAVEKVLAGEHDALKERNIAVDVFQRPPDTNLNDDTIVRVGAREVRRRLAQYHSSPQAAGDEIHLDLPAGSYVPEWHRLPAEGRPEPAPARRSWRPSPRLWLVAAACLATAAIGWLVWPRSAFSRFWQPYTSGGDVLIATAHPLVFHLSTRALSLDGARSGNPLPFMQRPPRLAAGEINGDDLVPVPNQYVGFGDMVAASEVMRTLGVTGVNARLRMSTQVDFSDLRDTPLILIGAFSNRWTMELTRNFRFHFVAGGAKPAIGDRSNGRSWTLSESRDDGTSQEDYVLVSRVLDSPTGKPLISAAGLKQFGTETAGHILSSESQLKPILDQLPAGWEKRNLQVLLRVQVIGNSPAAPSIVATHLW